MNNPPLLLFIEWLKYLLANQAKILFIEDKHRNLVHFAVAGKSEAIIE